MSKPPPPPVEPADADAGKSVPKGSMQGTRMSRLRARVAQKGRHYERLCNVAERIKAYAQMTIGFLLFLMLLGNAYTHLAGWPGGSAAPKLMTVHPLTLVAWGLMYAAGIELCYMLYTKGPDEAVNPVIMGIASAVLLVLANPAADWRHWLVVPLLILAMLLLFFVRAAFFDNEGSR